MKNMMKNRFDNIDLVIINNEADIELDFIEKWKSATPNKAGSS